MAKNLLVVSVDIRETRVALIENGIIAELHIERRGKTDHGSVGDVVLGKVTRVLPGLQAAFIDIGQERAAFLHVEDLIRPDDFDAYLAGGRKHAREDDEGAAPEVTGNEELDAEAEASMPAVNGTMEAARGEPGESAVSSGEASSSQEAPVEAPPADVEASAPELPSDPESAPDVGENPENGAETEADDNGWDAAPEAEEGEDTGRTSSYPPPTAVPPTETSPSAPTLVDRTTIPSETPPMGTPTHSVGRPRGAAAAVATGLPDDLDMTDMPGFTIHDAGEPMPRAARPHGDAAERRRDSRDLREGRGRRRGRRGRSDRDRDRDRDRGNRDRPRGGGLPGRISKTTPIREVVKEGQEIIVQVSKDPIGTKGARCTSHISLPGRYVVYLPTVEHVGVSKRIGSEKERARLRETIESMKPPSGGLIVRTVAEGLTKKQLKQDVGYLVRLWGEIAKKREGAKAPTLLSSELDLVLKTARDLFTDEVEQIVIDDKGQYERLKHFVEMFMPDRLKDIVLYTDAEPIFDAYGIEDEIGRALSRKVPLPSGGYLIIDQAEALTAIDVNTGRFVGKGSKDMEDTILKTNLEAVHEIAYQLRFRNIGGLIILDLIDMERHQNREKVRRELEEVLKRDKAKTTLNRISELGLIEMTRKRTRESLGRLLHEPCFYCDGTGQLQSKETIAYEILREIRRRRNDLPGYTVVVHAHPAVADLLQGPEKAAVADAENRYMRKIQVIPRTEYHLEQFDLSGK